LGISLGFLLTWWFWIRYRGCTQEEGSGCQHLSFWKVAIFLDHWILGVKAFVLSETLWNICSFCCFNLIWYIGFVFQLEDDKEFWFDSFIYVYILVFNSGLIFGIVVRNGL